MLSTTTPAEKKFTVDYDGQIYEYTWLDSMTPLSFDMILGQRPLIHCWLEDSTTKVWIRIPRIEVLRSLVKEERGEDCVFKLRFQRNNKSPNTAPQLTLTKNDTSNEQNTSETEKSNLETVWTHSWAENIIQPFTQMTVTEMSDDDMVVIQQESGELFSPRLCLHAESLLQSIQIDAEKGINPFDVVVRAEDGDHQWQEVKLTRRVWMKCLLRGNPQATLFMDYLSAGFENMFNRDRKLKELHSNKDLWLRLKCFLYDLLHFNEEASSRLQGYGGEYYMSNRYFSSTELDYLLNFPTASGVTARQSLQLLFSSKEGTGRVTEVCTSHDIAPAIEKLFGIRKGFEDEKVFKEYFKKFARRTMLFD